MGRTYRIWWAPVAFQDLDEIVDYIATQAGAASAVKTLHKLRRRGEALAIHPTSCRFVPELRSLGVLEYRELLVSPYRVFFRIVGSEVRVVGVLDGRRDLEETLVRRAMR